jgi:hypothetical protein
MMEPTRKELGGCVVGYVKMVYSFFFFFYMSTQEKGEGGFELVTSTS